MSGDMRKSYLLRAFLFVVATVALWISVGIVDALYAPIFNHLTGFDARQQPIEGAVFIWVTSKIIWRWLKRRVWIGTAAPSPAQRPGEAQ